MSKHTPGPWKYSDMKDFDHFAISQEEGAPYTHHSSDVGSAFYMLSCQPKPVAEANARLIAAAPDLLYCLQQIIRDLPTRRDWLDPVIEKMARAAIAKAEGE